jgi:hypothetical protein
LHHGFVQTHQGGDGCSAHSASTLLTTKKALCQKMVP